MATPLQTNVVSHGNPLGTPQGAAGDPSGSPSVAPNFASRSVHGRENAYTSLGTFQVCTFHFLRCTNPFIALDKRSSNVLQVKSGLAQMLKVRWLLHHKHISLFSFKNFPVLNLLILFF
jgi:hypothetical protein